MGSRAATRRHTVTPGAPHPSWSNASAPCAAAKASGRTASPGRSGSPVPPSTPCSGASASIRLDQTASQVSRKQLRYEHPAPGDLLHLDVKKLGRIPEGGGHRVRGRSARTPRTRGLDYLHVAVDDHSRYAYVEALPDERGVSCAAFLQRALNHFRARGVRVRRVLTYNAKAYTVSRSLPRRGRRRR